MNPAQDTPEKASNESQKAIVTEKVPSPKKVKKPVAKKSAAKKTVVKKAANDGINKSEEIRKVASELKVKGEKVRPKTIVEILKKRGIKIAPPQASMVLKKAGFRPGRRSSEAAAGKSGPVVKKASKSTLTVDELLRAKKMAEEFGGAEKLVNAISALVELQ